MGLGLSLTDDVVTEIKPDSQAARDGKIKVGDRVVTVNGEAPTAAKPPSAILQATGAGTIVKLELTSEPKAVSAGTEKGQSSSVSVEPLKVSITLVRTQPGESFGLGVVGKTTTTLAISSVDAGGLAEAAGLQVDDCILTTNGFKVADRKQMSELLSSLAPGVVCTIIVTRVHPFGTDQISSVSADPSVSASPSSRRTQTVPVAVLARDAQKMRHAAELLESWKLEPSELIHGNKVGAGGQADVYLGRWQVSSRTSALLRAGSDSRYMLVLLSFYTLDYLLPSPTIHPRGCLSRSRSSAAVTIVRRARRRCVPSPRPCAARCAPSRACATQTWSGCTERAWSSHRAS